MIHTPQKQTVFVFLFNMETEMNKQTFFYFFQMKFHISHHNNKL